MLERFNLDKVKVVSSPLATHFKLNTKENSSTDEEKKYMKNVSYTSTVGSLMYEMVCTILDIAHSIGVVSRFLSNPKREH